MPTAEKISAPAPIHTLSNVELLGLGEKVVDAQAHRPVHRQRWDLARHYPSHFWRLIARRGRSTNGSRDEHHRKLLPDFPIARVEHDMARVGVQPDVSLSTGDHSTARAHYQNVLELSAAMGYRQGEAGAHHGLGNVARATGHNDTARTHYHKALEEFRDIGDQYNQADVHHSLGDLTETEDPQTALKHYVNALSAYTTISNHEGQDTIRTKLIRTRNRMTQE